MFVNQPRAWQMLDPTIKLVWKPRGANNWTILPKVSDFIFLNKVHSESWSSTNVSPNVVAATFTLQNFSLSFWSLPTNLHRSMSFFVKYISSSDFLVERQPVDQTLIHSPHRLFIWTWSNNRLSSSFNNFHKSGEQLAFPPEIAQSWLVAYWALKLRNFFEQPSPRKLHIPS